MEPWHKGLSRAAPQESVHNFINSIEERHLEQLPAYQKALIARQTLPDKEYVQRYFLKKAKYEFITNLIKKLQEHSKGSTEWGKDKLAFLQRVRETLRFSMHSESAFAGEEQKRRVKKEQNMLQEKEKRLI